MAEIFTQIVSIERVEPHPDARSLDLVKLENTGYTCISQKGLYRPGDKAVFLSPETIIPPELEKKAWEGSTLSRPKNGRIKAIKLRGIVSPGLLLSLETCGVSPNIFVGTDVAKLLNLKKYEPGEAPNSMRGNQPPRAKLHKDFDKYSGIENAKHFVRFFDADEDIIATIKHHGSNLRASWQPMVLKPTDPLIKVKVGPYTDESWFFCLTFETNLSKKNIKNHLVNLRAKALMSIGFQPKYEFVCGSHNCELEDDADNRKNNVFFKTALKYNLKEKLQNSPEYILYGEVLNVQKNFTYGYKPGEVGFIAFDVKYKGRFLSYDDAKSFCWTRDIPFVPEVYRGKFDLDKLNALSKEIDPILEQGIPCREGLVLRSVIENPHQRKVLKLINDEYHTLKGNTDWH